MTSIVQNGDIRKEKKVELKPLSKQEALRSIRKFKQDFGLTKIHTNKQRLQALLKKTGSLSEEVNKMRHEQDM